jgi:hypothetical protein
MKVAPNRGFDSAVIADYKAKMKQLAMPFYPIDEEDNSDEYFHFYFIGKHKGQEVIYDTVLCTLRFEHESEVYDVAEHRAAKHFPHYKKIAYEEDENGNLKALDSLEEEIGLYMAEVILELQEEAEVKVREYVDMDESTDFGVSLDVGLNVEKISHPVIQKFIKDFNEGTLQLDDTLYSFQAEEEEA